MKRIRGSFEESFNDLNGYSKEMQNTNPGKRTFLVKCTDSSFLRYFWYLGSCIQSFKQNLHPLIVVDGTHLSEKYPSILFVAATQDVDHRLFPIAFIVVEKADLRTWLWFFTCFNASVGFVPNLTAVSDRMKGLPRAVTESFPHAFHCYCVHHVLKS